MPKALYNQFRNMRKILLDPFEQDLAKRNEILLTLKMIAWSESLGVMDDSPELHSDIRNLLTDRRYNFALDAYL